jgi:hypothetical protein
VFDYLATDKKSAQNKKHNDGFDAGTHYREKDLRCPILRTRVEISPGNPSPVSCMTNDH